MATKKKSGGTKRRKKVGAMSLTANSPLVKFGSIAIGYLMGDTLNQKLIDKLFGTPTDPVKTGKMVAVGQIGLGGALVFLKLGKKSLVSEVAGGLLIGSGIKRAMVVFKEGATTMSGYGDVPVIGAYAPNSSLNGTSKVMGSMGGSTLIG